MIDFVNLQGIDVCLMYFAIPPFIDSIRAILQGERLEREGNYFYPTGRCASVSGMRILFDPDGFLANLQKQLDEYPEILAQKMIGRHRDRLNDIEDFGRAVARGDVLFYHATLDLAVDRFLQVLFARNRRYFPGRKRTLAYIEGFEAKPEDCIERLLRVVELGARPETLGESYLLWQRLCRDLCRLLN